MQLKREYCDGKEPISFCISNWPISGKFDREAEDNDKAKRG